jgi:hypothetical protein
VSQVQIGELAALFQTGEIPISSADFMLARACEMGIEAVAPIKI